MTTGQSPPSGVLRFGRFCLDPANGQVWTGDTIVPLGVTARRLLTALTIRPGALIGKQELIDAVWGNAAVGDNMLHVQMALLRRAIGAETIVTRSGQGYRFVAHLQSPEDTRPTRRRAARRMISAPETALPPSEIPLIGREADLRRLVTLIRRRRLVTLTGPGGVGKTRLLAEAVHRLKPHFPDGVTQLELAPIGNAALLGGVIGAALGLDLSDETAGLALLGQRLAGRRALLVIDNCEHLLEPVCRLVAALLVAAPGLSIAATSRAPLACRAEQIFSVPPLDVDGAEGGSAEPRRAPAIDLFTASARLLDPRFSLSEPDIARAARICRSVDGLPLAIQFAAGWASVLGLAVLEQRLSDAMSTARGEGGESADRHGTLGAAFEWGHDLLGAPERMALRRLAVFADGFDLDAAEQVVIGPDLSQASVWDVLLRLVRHSMVSCIAAAPRPRYRLLQTTRVFALAHLHAAGEAPAIRDRHAAFVQRRLDEAEAAWEAESDAVWLDRYAPILPDLREALDWLMGAPEHDPRAVRLAAVSWPLWRELSLPAEGGRRLRAAAARISGDIDPGVEMRLRQGLGDMLGNSPDLHGCRAAFRRAIALGQAVGDRLGVTRGLVGCAYTELMLTEADTAAVSIAMAMQELTGGRWPRASAAACLIQFRILAAQHDYGAAMQTAASAIALCEAAGILRAGLFLKAHLMEVLLEMERVGDAAAMGHALLDQLEGPGHASLRGSVAGNLAAAAIARGQLDEGLSHAREALRLLDYNGMQFWLFDHLSLRVALAGRLEEAAMLAGHTDALYEECAYPRAVNEQRARARLRRMLEAALGADFCRQLIAFGRQMPKARALALATVA